MGAPTPRGTASAFRHGNNSTNIGSMGNVPLAAMLWAKNASFGRVMSFLGADLVAATVIYIHARYYGSRYALFLSALLYACMVTAGVTAHYIFAALQIMPTERPTLEDMVRFSIDYAFWLNFVFALVGGLLLVMHRRARQTSEARTAPVRAVRGRPRRESDAMPRAVR